MSCTKTHKLRIATLGSQVTRTWIKLSDGLAETDTTVLASLEATIADADCEVSASSDSELKILCDSQVTQFGTQTTQFLRRYTIGATGVTFDDTTLDGTTAYVSQGNVAQCETETPFDTEFTCYTTDAETTPQAAWVRHSSDFVGLGGQPNVNPAGFAVFSQDGQPVDISQAGFTLSACTQASTTVQGFTNDYTGTTPAVLPAAITSPVRSITLSVRDGAVVVVTSNGTSTFVQGDVFTWNQGVTDDLDITGWTFTGDADAVYVIHGEKVI